MKEFIKGWLPWVLGAIVLVYLLITGWSCGQDYLRTRVDAAAKAKYESALVKKDAEIKAAQDRLNAISEKAARDRETLRSSAAAELGRRDALMAVFKSESAKNLRQRQAKLEEVLEEKERDEITIAGLNESVDYLVMKLEDTLLAWKVSDENRDAEQAKINKAREFQLTACKEWSNRLEKRLKKTFWGTMKQVGERAAWFSLGRLSTKVF